MPGMEAAMKYTRFSDIPRLTRSPGYRVNIGWSYLEEWIARQEEDLGRIEIVPDFQRGHVWTPEQRSRYVEFRLRGGESGRDIMWNHPSWRDGEGGVLQLVDGLQRLTAVRGFLRNEVPAFGSLFREYTDKMSWTAYDFIFYVNDLKTRADVLRWYLEINSGGTPHSSEEIARVASLLDAEKAAAA